MRNHTLTALFKHTRVSFAAPSATDDGSLHNLVYGLDVANFLAFVDSNNLSSHVTSVVLYSTSLEGRPHGAPKASWLEANDSIDPLILLPTLLDTINPQKITVMAHASVLSSLVSCQVAMPDSWAFGTPLHTLHLSQSSELPLKASMEPNQIGRFFDSRLWNHFILNEGSSLKAYITYEYNLKRTPSVLPSISMAYFTSLKSFDFIAIFPLMSHVHDLVKFIENLPRLERLQTQLAPNPSSNVLRDEINTRKNCVPSDFWMEFDGGYTEIINIVFKLGREAKLMEFVALDYAVEGLRQGLEEKIGDVLKDWQSFGGGTWQKDDQQPVLPT
ncbi:hypothetical protein MMC12_001208 [Toensbergia leucococca]|nr:hypothetical protein [Toensbergia leucococca]